MALSMLENGGGGGDYSLLTFDGGGASGASVPQSPVSSPTPVPSSPAPSGFDFDLSAASIAAARAKGNVESDIRSAYQTFISGVPSGRGGQYAIDAQRRFGYSSITEAAAAYLDAAGLRRLILEDTSVSEPVTPREEFFVGDEQFFGLPVPDPDPEPGPDTKGVVTNNGPEGPGNPFDTIGDLADLFERIFAVNEPETTAPVVVVGDATGGGGTAGIIGYDDAGQPVYSDASGGGKRGGGGLGLILLVLAVGAGAFYWFYWRKRNAG